MRLSLAAQHCVPDCYIGPVWRWAMALQFISRCSPPTRAPGARSSSVRALRKMDWLAGPPEEAKRVAKRLCSTWLLSYASLIKDVFNGSLEKFFCIICLNPRMPQSLEDSKGCMNSYVLCYFYLIMLSESARQRLTLLYTKGITAFC